MGEWIIDFLVTSSILILTLLVLRVVLRGRISMRLQYAMWLLVAAKLLLFPIPWMESSFSILHIVNQFETEMKNQVSGEAEMYLPMGETGMSAAGTDSNYGETVEISKPEQKESSTGVEENRESGKGKLNTIGFLKEYWEILFVAIWRTGIFIVSGMMIVWNHRFQLLLRKKRIPLKQDKVKFPVYLVEKLPSPCLYRKAIYITPAVAEDEEKLRHVLAHESCHAKHHDESWALLRCICLACYWWHPLVWLAARISKQDCELACDEAAIELLGESERIAYGKTLIGLITQKPEGKDYFSISTTMSGSGKEIKNRVRCIAGTHKNRILACIVVVLLAGLTFFCTVTGDESVNGGENGKTEDVISSETQEETTRREENGGTEEEENMYDTEPGEEEAMESLTPEQLSQMFHQLVTEGGICWLNVNQIILDANGDSLSEEIREQYQIGMEAAKAVLIYQLSEDLLGYEWDYNEACENGEITWEKLMLSPDCRYYMAKSVGSLEKTEVTFDEFMEYFREYERPGKECQVFFADGYISEITLLNPYEGILFQNIGGSHFFYEEFGTEEFYGLAASYEADVEHTIDASGAEQEIIEVYTGNVGDGESGMVLVKNASGKCLWDAEAHVARASWNNIYLTNIDGEDYLFELQIDIRGDYGGLYYFVYSLESQASEWDAAVLLSGASFDYEKNDFNEESYERWADAMNPYLENATLLLSTQNGEIRTEPVNEYEKYNQEALLQSIRADW